MLELFRRRSHELREQVQQLASELRVLRSYVTPRLQQLEEEHVRIQLQRFLSCLHEAAETAIRMGLPAALAIAKTLRAVAAPLPRGKAGGLARSRSAWRYSDGTFMPESEKFEFYREEYERHASGGRARARNAARTQDGRFC